MDYKCIFYLSWEFASRIKSLWGCMIAIIYVVAHKLFKILKNNGTDKTSYLQLLYM